MVNVKLSAFADEYADLAKEQARAMKQFNIGHIEVRHLDGKNISTLSEKEVRDAKILLDDFGIRVSAIGSPLGKIRLDGNMDEHLEAARRVFEYANILGAHFVRVFSFYAPDGKNVVDMRGEAFDAVEKLVVLARKYGVTLCHENEAKIYGDIPSRCKELMEHFGGELKCVFDMGNFVLEGVDPYEAYKMLQDDIAYFHIKDALYAGAIVPAGRGEARIKDILDLHRGYANEDFFVSLEPHLQTFSGLNALVGRAFKNPYQYEDQRSAFADAITKFMELI